ncbi:MCP four helix bundle domain-containing protein, partial [Noviherbaspirillum massiliense]|uniref:MCP four helix bundle domain-containing protein n=1 Tax=Noviherbaspirillum massiliense TaxID=1465823 RepID=UPI00054DF459
MKVSNLKIGTRLGLGFAAVLVLATILAVIGIAKLQDVARATEEMDVAIHKARLSEKWYAGSVTNDALTEARLRARDASDDQAILARMKARSAEISKVQEELKSLITTEEGEKLIATIADKRKTYMDIRNQVFALRDSAGTDPAQIKAFVESKMAPAMGAYHQSIMHLVTWQDHISDEAK